MPDKPNRSYRRFFQFRLSTWLVLVGIVAWAMATRPFLVPIAVTALLQPVGTNVWNEIGRFDGDRNDPLYREWLTDSWKLFDQLTSVNTAKNQANINAGFKFGSRFGPNRRLLYPALALVAFLGWKAFWLVRATRRSSAP